MGSQQTAMGQDLFRQLDYRILRSATNPVVLPQLEPRAMRQLFIVPSIRGRDVGFLQWPDIRSFEHLFQLLDFINYAFNVHPQQYN
jgi:hypothetical protein